MNDEVHRKELQSFVELDHVTDAWKIHRADEWSFKNKAFKNREGSQGLTNLIKHLRL